MEYSLRTARQEDYDFLYELHKIAFKEYVESIWGWKEEEQQEFFRKGFVPDEDKKIIEAQGSDAGYFTVKEEENNYYIKDIVLLPEMQGKGLGTTIIKALIKEAGKKGKGVRLQVFIINKKAKKLYERLGFKVTGENKTHFQMLREIN